MLAVEILRSRGVKLADLYRLIPVRNWCGLTMPEAGEKREAETNVVDEESVKKAKLEEVVSTASEQSSQAYKWKLKKFAMCLAYCGKGYLGLQRNNGFKTIEGDLMVACFKAGFVTEEAMNRPQEINFQRAARTDKGVSASRQILSLKLPTTKDTPEKMVEKINEHLDSQIRVIGLKRVTKNFNSKNNADARTYLYICPTFAFIPKDEEQKDSYRMPAERVQEINDILKLYLGCRNYHNFTSGRPAHDPSAKRFMIDIECGMPFLVGNMEYVQFRIKGQSFMLHQIRKMVGVVIGIMKGYTTKEFILRAFGSEKLDLPKAPGLGLMLDTVHYTRYDNRYGGDGSHEAILWDEYQSEVDSFKKEKILPTIWDTEEKEESMMTWLEELKFCRFDAVRDHESVPKNIQDAPDDECYSDEEENEEDHMLN